MVSCLGLASVPLGIEFSVGGKMGTRFIFFPDWVQVTQCLFLKQPFPHCVCRLILTVELNSLLCVWVPVPVSGRDHTFPVMAFY